MKNITNKKNNIFFSIILLFLVFLSFLTPIYNWDLDHEMYFGSRLLAGELIWTREFHDKLPFVQFICVIPAYFKTIYAFKIYSMFFMALFSLCVYTIIPKIFLNNNRKDDVIFSIIMFFFILYFSFGSLETINCIAVSLYGISFLFIIYDNFSDKLLSRLGSFSVLFFGSCSAAMAISIRPYYITAVGVALVCSILLGNSKNTIRDRPFYIQKGLKFFVWGAAIGVWGGALNILPYALTGQMSAFRDGLTMLGGHINPLSTPRAFFHRMRKYPDILLWGSWFLMGISAFLVGRKNSSIKNENAYKIFFISIFSALAIAVYVLCEHYWAHYIQLFVANYCICLVSLLFIVRFSKKIPFSFKKGKGIQSNTLGYIFFVAVVVFLLVDLKKEISEINRVQILDVVRWQSTSNNWKENMFRHYMAETYPSAKPSFLFPDDMKAHWILGEPRYGFPHAANTKHIFLGWWSNITFRSSHFFIVSNGEQYCSLIHLHGPSLIIVQPDSALLPCLTNTYSNYKLETALEEPIGKIIVFKRLAQE